MTKAFLAHLLSLLVVVMTSFREARDVKFLSYDQGLISDDKFLLLDDLYKPQNLDFPYNLYTASDLG